MIASLLSWKLGIGIFRDEVSKGRLLALELARLVVWLDPVCDGGFVILRGVSGPIQPDCMTLTEKGEEQGGMKRQTEEKRELLRTDIVEKRAALEVAGAKIGVIVGDLLR
jgi:hypothetical protein